MKIYSILFSPSTVSYYFNFIYPSEQHKIYKEDIKLKDGTLQFVWLKDVHVRKCKTIKYYHQK